MPRTKRKIVFFATQLYRLPAGHSGGFGGAETEMWNVARQMAADGKLDVTAMAVTSELKGEQWFDGVRLVAAPAVRPISYSDPWLKRRKEITRYYFGVFHKARQERGDFYFAKLASAETFIIWLAARTVGAKFIFRIEHDWETAMDTLTQKIFNGAAVGARLFRTALRQADLVVVQTQRQAEAVQKNFGVNATIIPNGHVMPDANDSSRGFHDRHFILWVARVHPMKRPKLFLDLARKNPQIQFCMVLSTHPAFEPLFKECKSAAEALPNVEFLPGIPPDQINTLYQRARAFVLTSEAEGFSNVIIEAMKNGAPVITLEHNPDSLLLDVSADQDAPPPAAGYCTGDDMSLTSQLIQRLSSDQSHWLQCHRLSRQTAEQNFSVENVAAIYSQKLSALHPPAGPVAG